MTATPYMEHLPSDIRRTRLADRSNRLIEAKECQTCRTSFVARKKDAINGSTSYIMGGSCTEIRSYSMRKRDDLKSTDSFLHIGTHGNFGHDVEIFQKNNDDQFYLSFCSPKCLRTYLNSLVDLIELRISQQQGLSKISPGIQIDDLISTQREGDEDVSVEGWVFNRKGTPIEDALVSLLPNRGRRPTKPIAISNPLGFFRLPMTARLTKLIQQQKIIRCSVSKPGFAPEICELHPEVEYQGVVELKKAK